LRTDPLKALIIGGFVRGLSMRDVESLCEEAGLGKTSRSTVSRVCAEPATQRSGECWMGGTSWHGMRLMRISVANWRTTEADVDRSVNAILAARSRITPRLAVAVNAPDSRQSQTDDR
jgi:hypothetical protein